MARDGICKGPIETAHHCKLCEGGMIDEAAVMGSEFNCVPPMPFFWFYVFTDGLSHSAGLYRVMASE